MEAKYTIIQSFWTKPVKDKDKLGQLLYIAGLSLTYAHKNGYKINMHTDSYGYELLKNFGYDNLYKTLDEIPDTVPIELFAAGKFYAMKAEGITGKIHIDFDVFIKKPHLLDRFYEDKTIDVIAQQEENYEESFQFYGDIINTMHIIGYPSTTRPNWKGIINVGVIGFNNEELANKYFNNYFNALNMYNQNDFNKYKGENRNLNLSFDFILEQTNLSYYSLGYNVYILVPSNNPSIVADQIGYQHLQGGIKWKRNSQIIIKQLLEDFSPKLYIMITNIIKNI